MNMLGLDTNVVIRLLTNDDPAQRRTALRFAEGLGVDYTAYLTLVGIVELDWALRSRLGFSRQASTAAIGKLLQTRGLVIEHHDLVVKALRLATTERADFADALIAARSLDAGCVSIKTFDQKAANRVPGMELLA
ncbi:putative nucleic-acid-binding protein [Neorhizobium huautlense]|uniref:Nucleic-acid-binding protein n=1 Tax=Neorhizobium huautlense TaxID=67774 RepID=A0ABT9PX78_9HYPH|nr:type II toxin-antitoxin system VapC family toxin [Neorhizobium huautlense]MDP9838820.1 putative nucleic-acid-binding protein [Neorhizobium huautlense]